jgi:hypothetical protein
VIPATNCIVDDRNITHDYAIENGFLPVYFYFIKQIKMNTRTLGLIGILCSPFLAIQLSIYGIFENYKATSLAGIFSLIYMTGWMCSIVGLYKLSAAGNRRIGKTIILIQLIFLSLGEIWNFYSIMAPGSTTTLYRALDLFWPISNLFMFVTGLFVLRAKQLHGWKRFIPFIVGLWFPITVVMVPAIFGHGQLTVLLVSLYSVAAWSLLGLAVYQCLGKNGDLNTVGFSEKSHRRAFVH